MCNLTDQEIIAYLNVDNTLSKNERKLIREKIFESKDCQRKVEKIKKRLKKEEAKRTMLPHSRAKVEMYSKYLEKYLAILTIVPNSIVKEINVLDVMCGRGIYEKGGKGSPIKAFDIAKTIQSRLKASKRTLKRIRFIFNDKEEQFTTAIKTYIDKHNDKVLKIEPEYRNYEVEDFFPKIIDWLKKQSKGIKNLIFIDPYGYKDIHKDILVNLLKNRNTEIVLFLPINQMHRFKEAAIDDDENKGYEKLRNFIFEFFAPSHPLVKGERTTSHEFINELN